MRNEDDFANGEKNPFNKPQQTTVTLRLDNDAVAYFKKLALEINQPYHTLITSYLNYCAKNGNRHVLQKFLIEHFKTANEKEPVNLKKSDDIILTSEQNTILQAMLSGRDLFISGGAGVGKSVLIKYFSKIYKGSVVLCAPTGVAAVNINGATLHSVFKIPLKDVFTEEDIHEIYNNVYNYDPESGPKDKKLDVLYSATCFIIDEISMCRGDVFAMVMSCIKALRDNKRKIQVIVVGDFYQLPPVLTGKKSFTVQKADGSTIKISQKDQYKAIYGNASGFCFLNSDWNFKRHILCQIMRQSDVKFSEALNLIRIGNQTGLDYIYEQSSKFPLDAIWICGRNKDAEERNNRELDKIRENEYFFPIKYNIIEDSEIDLKELREIALKTAKGDLSIKRGCSVVALVNRYDEKGDLLYCNGSRGKVTKINEDEGEIFVDFGNGEIRVTPYKWEEKRYHFNERTKKLDTKVIAAFIKYPLVLGYATTVHKSQGQTLDAVNIDRNCNFLPGQLYVSLSRAKNANKVYIEGKPVPLVSQEVINFYNENYNS